MYNIDVVNQDITNNSIGATIPYEFSLGGQYSGIASCTIPMENQAIYYSAAASLMQQGSAPGYLKLNDYMDVKIEIYIRGQRMDYFAVPFIMNRITLFRINAFHQPPNLITLSPAPRGG